jgi:hypothetical protein
MVPHSELAALAMLFSPPDCATSPGAAPNCPRRPTREKLEMLRTATFAASLGAAAAWGALGHMIVAQIAYDK